MDNRRFHRIAFQGPASLHLGKQHYETTLLDLSLKGALVTRPETLPEHVQQMELHFPLQDSQLSIQMLVSIAHQRENLLGLHCEKIDLDSISHLKRLVQLNLGDDQLLERELSELTHKD
ncbi:PilZ domain-containing protein [Alkalimonas delamerensis]|uniref:Cyclic diguanosine monophosphate-binding protein n=1 Tax=Alkalimonas delamerensis TaxID=265981 RepID=A0ABT9GS75_9GAMM|nr:PilZ domain-containing protein [Alkalimonas delamerensis]MDP4529830.1 PilZ domain-containing protein [Alkalimonas delamerensis]